ncbi:MAG: HEAT repeat domain-containing protein [Blastocatellia bacterium]|nr:HEAT repeat domain-containing protein [Blastocatellia bacterium]
MTEEASREFAPSEGFDQAVRDLRAGESAEVRAAAARLLLGAGSQRATPHLIAALFDADATVRATAKEILAQFGNSSVPGQCHLGRYCKSDRCKTSGSNAIASR